MHRSMHTQWMRLGLVPRAIPSLLTSRGGGRAPLNYDKILCSTPIMALGGGGVHDEVAGHETLIVHSCILYFIV